MGSVDKADQLLEPYAYERKSDAWFKKLGIHFMFRILLNSFLAFKKQQQDQHKEGQPKYKQDFLSFIIQASKDLASYHNPNARDIIKKCEDEKKQTPTKLPREEREEVHALVKWEVNKQKKCRVCYNQEKKRKDTRYYCPQCKGQPGICSYDHFRVYHK